MVAFGVPVRPRGGITFKSNERHIGRDALTDPATKLWGLEVLKASFGGVSLPKLGGGCRRVGSCK